MSPSLRNSAIWLGPLLLILLAACTKKPDIQLAQQPDTSRSAAALMTAPAKSSNIIALDVARKMLGVTYRYGGTDPSGFDCSGLVQYSYQQAGIRLPRTSDAIFRHSQLVNPSDIKPGDLVFFRISSNKVSHVGIYAGNRSFIHSPSSGKGVSYASLDNSYWRQRLVAVGRI